jgi:hypothetical protein
VSPAGFQKGAVQVAKAERIALLVAGDEIEFKPREVRTVLGFLRAIPRTPWFSRLVLTASAGDRDDIVATGRAFIPETGSHAIVPLGSAEEHLRHPPLRHMLAEADAYLCPCFLLVYEEDDLDGVT